MSCGRRGDYLATRHSDLLAEAAIAGRHDECARLLASGADPSVRGSDGKTAAGHAAFHGHIGVLGVLLGHDAALVSSVDALGRTPLHHAVAAGGPVCLSVKVPAGAAGGGKVEVDTAAGRMQVTPPAGLEVGDAFEMSVVNLSTAQLKLVGGRAYQQWSTVKYLLGRWGADAHAADAHGDTPVHLCANRPMLLLLFHGPSRRPSLSQPNAAGLSPPEAWAAAHCEELAAAAREPGSWLHRPTEHERGRATSFLAASASRTPPRAGPPPPWPRRLQLVHGGIVLLPFLWGARARLFTQRSSP